MPRPLALALAAALLAVVLAAPFPSQEEVKIVYGTDNRRDYYDTTEFFQTRIANNVVALIPSANLGSPNSHGVYHKPAKASTLRTTQLVCKSERFADQPTAAVCSGTLIAPDRVLTAGHCIDADKCSADSTKFVFDYYLNTTSDDMVQISEQDVFSCRRVYSILENKWSSQFSTFVNWDYAVVQLDRPVRGRTPAEVLDVSGATDAGVSLMDTVSMIGFPSGLPAKSDYGAKVVQNPGKSSGAYDYFEATTDSFGGNSGSGVLNADGKVVGILVRGGQDYVLDTSSYCYRVNTVPCSPSDCSGITSAEGVSYARTAVRAVPECETDADCAGSATGQYCDLSCAGDAICCTGWCSSQSKPRTFNESLCADYLNIQLHDVDDPSSDGGLSPGAVAGIVIAVLLAVVLVVVGVVMFVRRSARPRNNNTRSEALLPPPSQGMQQPASAASPPRSLAVQVPPNAQPGSTLQATTPDGRTIKFDLPPGAKPGSRIVVNY